MIWLSQLCLFVCWVPMAAWQARLIKHGRPILHGVWALLSAFLIAGAIWWAFPGLAKGPLWLMLALYAGAQGCMRLACFNICLNWFRGLSWTYMSPTSTSFIDKVELRMFGGREWVIEGLCLIAFAVANFFIYYIPHNR